MDQSCLGDNCPLDICPIRKQTLGQLPTRRISSQAATGTPALENGPPGTASHRTIALQAAGTPPSPPSVHPVEMNFANISLLDHMRTAVHKL